MRISVSIAVVVLLLVGLLAYAVAFCTIDPTFSVNVHQQASGDYRFEIDPNFVVRSVYSVTIAGPSGRLAQLVEPHAGVQHLTIPGNTPSGTAVTVDCELQYDRIAPLITRETKVVILP